MRKSLTMQRKLKPRCTFVLVNLNEIKSTVHRLIVLPSCLFILKRACAIWNVQFSSLRWLQSWRGCFNYIHGHGMRGSRTHRLSVMVGVYSDTDMHACIYVHGLIIVWPGRPLIDIWRSLEQKGNSTHLPNLRISVSKIKGMLINTSGWPNLTLQFVLWPQYLWTFLVKVTN